MKKGQVFKCNVCGNIIQLLHVGGGNLVCCGQPMEKLEEKTEDAGFEKHVPIIEKTNDGILIKVGSIPHPMEETHYIEWISVETEDQIYTKFLKPSDKPEAEFKISGENIIARSYCNIHGLWKSK